MKNEKINKKGLLLKITILFFTIIIIALLLDYFNILSFISKNLNFNFLNIIISSITVVFIFIITYVLIDQKSFEMQNDKQNKKIKVLISLLLRTYKKCIENIDLLESQEILEKYIIPKCDFNSTNDVFINNYKNYPFDFEHRIIDLIQTGIIDVDFLDNYLNIKDLYRKYVDMRITFFDIKKSNLTEHREVYTLIKIDQNDLRKKLQFEIKKLTDIKNR